MAKVGRPTKYTPELIEKAKYYVDQGYLEEGEVIPTIEGMALYLKIRRRTIYDWAAQEEKEEFSHIVEWCNAKQAKILMSGSLKNEMNPTISKLLLTKQGYSDKSIQEVSGLDGKPIETNNKWEVEFINATPKD